MSRHSKRTYDSAGRRAQAEQTRSRILLAARELLQREGFEAVTVDKLAQASEVSASTIYSLFRSKRGVLRALMDAALSAEKYQALLEELQRDTSPEGPLRMGAKIARQIYDAERMLIDIFRGAAIIAPELKELEQEQEQRRYLRQEETMREMARKQVFAEGVSLSKARDIVWAFTGRDLYRMLVIERGWSSDQYEEWLAQHLIQTLLKRR